jgi:hypothetical protein
MLYVVIERYKHGAATAIYERVNTRGRLLPDGLRYVASWVETNWERCFQVMETDDAGLFDQWTAQWSDLIDFEIVPVLTSAEAAVAARRDERPGG